MPAPKGNTNALKHGFYSRRFRQGELHDLELLLEPGSGHSLSDEIAMLRVTMRRTMELAEGIQDVEIAIRWLNVLGASAVRIAALLRTEKLLHGSQFESLDFLSMTVDQVTLDLGLRQPTPKELSEGIPLPRKDAP
jgi:uncharacterized protein YjcR